MIQKKIYSHSPVKHTLTYYERPGEDIGYEEEECSVTEVEEELHHGLNYSHSFLKHLSPITSALAQIKGNWLLGEGVLCYFISVVVQENSIMDNLLPSLCKASLTDYERPGSDYRKLVSGWRSGPLPNPGGSTYSGYLY